MANESRFTIIFGGNTAEIDKALKSLQKDLQKFGGDLEKLGKDLSVRVTAPIVAFGAAAFAAANAVDEGMDRIRSRTGATGQALEKLGQDFREVFRDVPQVAGEVSSVIAELNTRLGLSGKPLQELSTQVLNLARVTEEDAKLVVQATTRVFGDWSIATERQSETLDFLFKTSQATGIGVSRLSQLIVQFGAPLRQFGIGFEEASALMGKWEKEGVNTELVMGSLRIALGEMAERGVTDFAAGLRTAIAEIQSAKSNTEATAIAFEIFGRRAGADMAAAIREGRFAVSELLATLQTSTETINKAAEETKSFGEVWGILRNRVTLALDPLGKDLHKVFAEQVLPSLLAGIDHLKQFGEAFGSLPGPVKTTVVVFGGLVAAIGPALIAFGAIAKVIAPIIGLVATLAGAASLPALGAAFLAIGAAVMVAVDAWKIWKGITTEGAERVPLLKARIAELEKAIASMSDRFGGLANARKIVGAELAALESALAKARRELDGLNTSTKTASEYLGDLPVQLDRGKSSVKGLGAAVDATRANFSSFLSISERLRDHYGQAMPFALGVTTDRFRALGHISDTISEELSEGFSQGVESADELNARIQRLYGSYARVEGIRAATNEQRKLEAERRAAADAAQESQREAARGFSLMAISAAQSSSEIRQKFGEAWASFKTGFVAAATSGKDSMDGIRQVGVQTAQALQAGFSDLFFAVLTLDLDGAIDAFKNFGNSILRVVSDILAEKTVQTLLSFGGKAVDFLTGTTSTAVDAFAKGGIAGLGSLGPGGTDTIPAWLSRGEMVLNSDATRKLLSGDFSGLLEQVVAIKDKFMGGVGSATEWIGNLLSGKTTLGDIGGQVGSFVSANPGFTAASAAGLVALALQFSGNNDAAKAGQILGALAPIIGPATSIAVGAISGATGVALGTSAAAVAGASAGSAAAGATAALGTLGTLGPAAAAAAIPFIPIILGGLLTGNKDANPVFPFPWLQDLERTGHSDALAQAAAITRAILAGDLSRFPDALALSRQATQFQGAGLPTASGGLSGAVAAMLGTNGVPLAGADFAQAAVFQDSEGGNLITIGDVFAAKALAQATGAPDPYAGLLDQNYLSERPWLELPSLKYGGVVPGPLGSPQLVVAHGGEEFAGVGRRVQTGRTTLIFNVPPSRSGMTIEIDDVEEVLKKAAKAGRKIVPAETIRVVHR